MLLDFGPRGGGGAACPAWGGGAGRLHPRNSARAQCALMRGQWAGGRAASVLACGRCVRSCRCHRPTQGLQDEQKARVPGDQPPGRRRARGPEGLAGAGPGRGAVYAAGLLAKPSPGLRDQSRESGPAALRAHPEARSSDLKLVAGGGGVAGAAARPCAQARDRPPRLLCPRRRLEIKR